MTAPIETAIVEQVSKMNKAARSGASMPFSRRPMIGLAGPTEGTRAISSKLKGKAEGSQSMSGDG
jgi:hypothetical protein